MREIFRYLTYTADYDSLVILNTIEAYVYDFFFAFIASTAGFAAFVRTLLSVNLHLGAGTYSRITVDQTGFPGYYIYLFAMLALLYGGLAWNLDLSADGNWLHDMWPFFAVSIIVVFLHQWLTLRVRIKQATLNVMIGVMISQLFFSALLAFLPVVNYKGLNSSILNLMPRYVLNYNLPESRVYGRQPRLSLITQVSVGYSKEVDDTVVLVGMFAPQIISLNEVPDLMSYERDKLMETERGQLEIDLCADKSMPAKVIVKMIDDMRADGPFHLRFMIEHPTPYMGIPAQLGYYSPDNRGSQLRLEKNKIIVNDTIMSKDYLYNWLKNQSTIDGGKKVVVLNILVDGESDYRHLIGIFEEAYAARLAFINEQVKVKFNRPYDEYESMYTDREVWEFSKTLKHPLLDVHHLKDKKH